ncbi:unnamed protein product, partial [Schistosoma mattheei]
GFSENVQTYELIPSLQTEINSPREQPVLQTVHLQLEKADYGGLSGNSSNSETEYVYKNLTDYLRIHMVIGDIRQETLDMGFVLLGTRQQGVPVILRKLVLPGGFDPVSPSFDNK